MLSIYSAIVLFALLGAIIILGISTYTISEHLDDKENKKKQKTMILLFEIVVLYYYFVIGITISIAGLVAYSAHNVAL